MWGNWLGWSISAAIVVTVMGLILMVERLAGVTTAPVDFAGGYSQITTIALPVPPAVVMPEGQPGDPASIYRQIIPLVQEEWLLFERFVRNPTRQDLEGVEKTQVLNLLRQARMLSPAPIFSTNPDQIVTYDQKPALEALDLAGNAALRAAMLKLKSDPKQAIELSEAAFALGHSLYRERLTFGQLGLALQLVAGGAQIIERASKEINDTDRAEQALRFHTAAAEYRKTVLDPVNRIISSIDQRVIDRHAGDVFLAARQRDVDRMWRVEAVLKLGRYRYNASRRGDQLHATRVVRNLAQYESDPIVRLAAEKARDLTLEQYRMIR